jgi:hypothetical protein
MAKDDRTRRLIYSRKRNDKRTFGKYVYKQHFLDIIASNCQKEINEAKKRVVITSEGKYYYTPSREYVQQLKKYRKK